MRIWHVCPFGVGCRPELNEMQGGGISDSASPGKGHLPFPHEDRRDVTVWRLYVFFACRGFRKPPGPLFTPPAPSEGGRGEAQSGAEMDRENTSGRLAAGRCPPFKGVGGFRNYLPNSPGSGRCHQKPSSPFLLPLAPLKGGGAKRRRVWVWKARVR